MDELDPSVSIRRDKEPHIVHLRQNSSHRRRSPRRVPIARDFVFYTWHQRTGPAHLSDERDYSRCVRRAEGTHAGLNEANRLLPCIDYK